MRNLFTFHAHSVSLLNLCAPPSPLSILLAVTKSTQESLRQHMTLQPVPSSHTAIYSCVPVFLLGTQQSNGQTGRWELQ